MTNLPPDLDRRLTALGREIERSKAKWFWIGVFCGIAGMYLGYAIGFLF